MLGGGPPPPAEGFGLPARFSESLQTSKAARSRHRLDHRIDRDNLQIQAILQTQKRVMRPVMGMLPACADPEAPTAEELRAIASKVAAFQAIFDTH